MANSKSQSEVLQSVLKLAASGIPVFPCNIYKKPITKNGFKNASTEPEKIIKWWAKSPHALIGMPTGKNTKVFVLDVDVRPNDAGITGTESLAALESQHGALPETKEIRTQSGGRHLYFEYEADIKNSTSGIAPGLDIRGEGGYVIIPPSKGYTITRKTKPVKAPEWLINLIKNPPDKKKPNQSYGESALKKIYDMMRAAPEGQRNDTLNRAAFRLGELVSGGEIDESAGIRLKEIAQSVGLEHNEIEATFNSGFNAGLKDVVFGYGNGYFSVNNKGVFYYEKDTEGVEKGGLHICSRLDIVALTRNDQSYNHGRLLQWRDTIDNRRHEWAMPISLLAGDALEVRRELMDRGLYVSLKRKNSELLSAYIQQARTKKTALCVNRQGWYKERYILPKFTIGGDDYSNEIIVFQSTQCVEPAFSVSGNVAEWRSLVAAYAAGNSRLVFAISAAFAAPLLDVVNMEGGGFHLCGNSSKGKTTVQRAAASVWGNPAKYKRSWRTTANALEAVAAAHNDGFLILDEIKELAPKEAGAAAYLLANGSAKSRMTRAITVRDSLTWRLLFLSSGEIGLSELMRSVGENTHAGQDIRVAEITHKDFENIHGFADTATFVDKCLLLNVDRYYGAVGIEFLQIVVRSRAGSCAHKDDQFDIINYIKNQIETFTAAVVPDEAHAQIGRVARRFALVAAAGELATVLGLTGWPQGESVTAARMCFASWIESFGGTDCKERRGLLNQVRGFFEKHGSSRFEWVESSGTDKTKDRAGFYKTKDNYEGGAKVFYYVLQETFKTEVCKNFNYKAAIQELIDAGWLIPGNDGRPMQKPRIKALGSTVWVYAFNVQRIWDDDSKTTESHHAPSFFSGDIGDNGDNQY